MADEKFDDDNFDCELVDFLHEVFEKESDYRDHVSELHVERNSFLEVSTFLPEKAAIFASVTAEHFRNMMTGERSDIVGRLLLEEEINVCCLGARAGTDALAIVKSFVDCWKFNRHLVINVTLVESDSNWRSTAMAMICCLQKHYSTNNISLNFKYLETNFFRPISLNVALALRSADVVTAARFLCRHRKLNEEQMKTLKMEIFENMKIGSCLMLVELGVHYYEELSKTANGFEGVYDIYGPLLQKHHSLSLPAKKKLLSLYTPIFGRISLHRYATVAAWSKRGFRQVKDRKTEMRFYTPRLFYCLLCNRDGYVSEYNARHHRNKPKEVLESVESKSGEFHNSNVEDSEEIEEQETIKQGQKSQRKKGTKRSDEPADDNECPLRDNNEKMLVKQQRRLEKLARKKKERDEAKKIKATMTLSEVSNPEKHRTDNLNVEESEELSKSKETGRKCSVSDNERLSKDDNERKLERQQRRREKKARKKRERDEAKKIKATMEVLDNAEKKPDRRDSVEREVIGMI